jgi:hypothetical protein
MKYGIVTATLLVATCGSSVSNASTDQFVGRWTETRAETHCSVIQGFSLKVDGTALVNWANPQTGAVEHRDGEWTSTDERLHLSIAFHQHIAGAPSNQERLLSVVVNVDGSLDAASGRLETVITDNRDRNIDGQPYEIRCVYVRDEG